MPISHLWKRRASTLSEQEVLALAISSEEEDARIYLDFAEALRSDAPSSAKVFEEMAEVENRHRHRLIDLHKKRFGDHIPLIQRNDVAGFTRNKPLWLLRTKGLDAIRAQAGWMEEQARRFYELGAKQARDADTRKLLTDLALEEAGHETLAAQLTEKRLVSGAREAEDEQAHRMFVLQYVQPGLAGLMDGSVSTLAPLFAAAFATQNSHDALLVGLAASIGAGISMGFAEALSDDGALTGRGSPIIRGVVTGLMTTLGGVGHTLPYLIPDFLTATIVAAVVVLVELFAISWIRWKYMDTPFLSATFQIVVGGALVFLTGIAIGHA